jgi:ketosteroid isomerase-like protein
VADVTAEIAALEDRRWRAQIDEDIPTLEQLFADELSYTHSNGHVDTKESFIKAIANKVFDYRAEQRTDTAVTVIDSTALVTGRVAIDVVAGGAERHLDARYSVIWVRRPAGSWQFLCWQSTPLPR